MASRPPALERYLEFNSAPYYLRRRLLDGAWLPPADAAFVARALADSVLANGAEPISQAMYFEATANLTGDMLVKVDRMSMAHSLEVCCPLLDHELAELAARIPHGLKLRGGRGKYILARALGERLPAELLRLPKRGFSIPLTRWFRISLRSFLRDRLEGRGLATAGQYSSASLLYGVGVHRGYARVLLAEALPSILAIYFVLPRWGLVGAAWVATLFMIASRGFLTAWLVCRELRYPLPRYLHSIYARPLLAGLPALAALWGLKGQGLAGNGWTQLLAAATPAAALYYPLAFFVSIRKVDRKVMLGWATRRIPGLAKG
ncbi:MAG: hypothetical protein FJW37_03980 [Acidobacteria bacterium]|nr:hypothetical protein [Acidobacteriota bacterium]